MRRLKESSVGAEGSDFTDEAIQQSEEIAQRLQYLFSITTRNEVEKCLAVGLSVSITGDFDIGLIELQRGRDLLAGSDNWELFLQLSNAMAEIHLQLSNYEETVEICQLILNTWTPTAHSLEFLRALIYLICSHHLLDQFSLGIAAGDEWAEKLIVECPHCHWLRLCVKGLIIAAKDTLEGEQIIENVLELDASPSLIFLHCKLLLAGIYHKQERLDKSEQTFLSVCELYSVHFPHSILYIQCLLMLGTLYVGMSKHLEAEEILVKARNLFSVHFPLSSSKRITTENCPISY